MKLGREEAGLQVLRFVFLASVALGPSGRLLAEHPRARRKTYPSEWLAYYFYRSQRRFSWR